MKRSGFKPKVYQRPPRAPLVVLLTLDRLRALLAYDPLTGVFTRRIAAGNQKAGSVAGATNADGYRQISIDGKIYYSHRLAWFYVTGSWPPDQLDHKDETPGNDWFDNLRPASNAQNSQNKTTPPSSNTSGEIGVSWSEQAGKWRAYITVNGRQQSLGYHESYDVAVQARRSSKAAEHPFSIPKERPLQSEAYMNLVRAMPCAHCGRAPRSQFCHSDMGKGTGLKTDCRRGWPGCATCHYLIGSTGTFKRQEKRELEDTYGAQTRAEIVARGLWPARLPRWPE